MTTPTEPSDRSCGRSSHPLDAALKRQAHHAWLSAPRDLHARIMHALPAVPRSSSTPALHTPRPLRNRLVWGMATAAACVLAATLWHVRSQTRLPEPSASETLGASLALLEASPERWMDRMGAPFAPRSTLAAADPMQPIRRSILGLVPDHAQPETRRP